jgi:hypothetical protein
MEDEEKSVSASPSKTTGHTSAVDLVWTTKLVPIEH